MNNINNLKPFPRFCVTLGMLPTSYKESMTYEEQLLWLCNYLETEVIPKYNENVEAINQLITLYNQLKEYVDNYFENLDVQEEINNKLDEMAESGELVEIITAYLQLNGVLAFDSISDLEAGTNIIEGSTCYILGENNYKDGKGGFYKVRTLTSGDIIDGFNIVALEAGDTIIAERMPNYYINQINDNLEELNNVNIKYDILVDINGNGDYTSLTTAVSNASDGDIIFVKNGTYTNEVVNCSNKNLTIIGESKEETIIQNDYDDYYREPLTIYMGKVKNISIKQVGSSQDTSIKSYAVHIDNVDAEDKELIFDNCYFYSLTHAAVGVGLYPNFNLVFNNCTFRSDHNLTPQNEHRGALFLHNSNSASHLGFNQNLTINNCHLSTLYGSVLHFEHCYNIANNKANFIAFNSSLYSDELGIQAGLITQERNASATDNSIVLSDKNGGNNYPTLNHSENVKAINYKNVVGKYGNNEINNEIKRIIIDIPVTAGQLGDLSLSSYGVTKVVGISGIITISDGGVFPLSHNGDNAGDNIACWANNIDKKLSYFSYLAGTLSVTVDYI